MKFETVKDLIEYLKEYEHMKLCILLDIGKVPPTDQYFEIDEESNTFLIEL